MLTETLAIYAAITSTISLIISYFAFRSGDPKLSGVAEIRADDDEPWDRRKPHNYSLFVALYNRGRGAITVDSIEVYCDSLWRGPKNWTPSADSVSLPVRIAGNSGVKWDINIPRDDVRTFRGWKSSGVIEVNIGLATGETLNLQVYKVSVLPGL
ncbi:MAG TPA: hypothetical protein VMA73_14640 [Streptosporangiaceae bacterium]|nr:hypothetical protein [Streptosporangiaceae bacterium]